MSSDSADRPLESPCRRQCCLDEHDQCLGCGRTLQEILDWGAADNARRRQIAAAAEQRLRQRRSTP
ncbi:DUF1289 domain-containing protein [Ectopseudomonas hydrolytica]|jgi:hypothetical protein|uniref:DUF1289 domain-containing protein n=1 Tax=Ectopseudomonas mendocina (strain ymp) TaxID=399739 RepID=A4XNX8_ECTM1|nr:DUF1289 domain-containing protein [Pseudomonas hydrolytica]ATH84132.1 DUF1289 domain-containing protein [Pseudomonas mendocina]EJO94827.1 hypothetical protein A471_07021 [Pseudomonas mendocina DLHK]MBF8160240.1 DUF1289 domain-containing protein [Pseudomonas mendocina]UTH31994.1 DUF1289 domain-containing protein [Pseudomonas hydrolytica]UZZ11171.1 DUF1289 domain-containing protein [Pseudomonas mendocina]